MSREELFELAARDRERAFAAALEAMASPDRNVRVAALRIVGEDGRPEGAVAILAGLKDPKRRVRDVALKASKRYLGDPATVAAIVVRVEDESETSKLRARALFALGGGYPSPNRAGEVPSAAIKALEKLADSQRLRGAVLARLTAMDLTDDVAALLQEFVRSGTKDEAVAATRALCGYRLVNWGNASAAELAAAGAQPAGGVYHWVPRTSTVGPAY